MKVVFLALLVAIAETFAAVPADLVKAFLHPPSSSRPWVYWFWMNGNVTSNGITADLQAMHRVGIGGVLIMEVDYDTPKGPVTFASREWRGLFQHVCAEAARLRMEVRMNNDAGYCGSGGPWITPKLSMQKLVWTETRVRGPADVANPLPQPDAVEGFYRDVAILAFPTPAEDMVRMADFEPVFAASPGVTGFDAAKLYDGDSRSTIALPQPTSENPSFVRIEFVRPFVARQLTLKMPLAGDQVVHGFLQASDDGETFRPVREFDVIPSTQVFNFPEVTARFFRVFFPRRNPDVEQFVISELEISSRLRIEGIEAKALFARKNAYPGPSEFPGLAQYPEPKPGLAVRRDSILELTRELDADGRLHWEPPVGNWTVLRLGHTSTGKKNHPAPEAGLGLECDKLSKAATEAAFEGFIGRLASDVKPFVSKSLLSVHIDSWEVGSQNWTAGLPAEFRQRRGYDPLLLLPVMTGRIVDSAEISERFLWDLRHTVSEMVADNYAGHMRTLANRRGLGLSIEAYDGPNDDLTYAGRADEPMAEFWTWPAFEMTYTCTEMSSAAHVYGKRIIGAEAFTAMDAEKWLGHPFSIKPFGDRAFCEGVNRLVIHRYALQPWTDPTRLPGMAFGPFGVHFERTQTWWEQSRGWNLYLARCQHLLRQGLAVADICYLAPETTPRRWRPPNPGLKDGYNFDGCPAEVLLTRMGAKDGKLVLPDGMNYRLLALQETETMTPEVLSRIREIVNAGATVVGAPPLKSPSLSGYPDCDSEVSRLVQEIWGDCDGRTRTEHRLGKGKVIWGPTPQQVLAGEDVPPDFIARTTSGPANFNYTHRTLPRAEVYFLANRTLTTEEAICSFRVRDSCPQFWRPETGEIETPGAYEVAPDQTVRMPIRLGPAESVFVVFPKGEKPQPDRIVAVTRENTPVTSTRLPPAALMETLPDGSNSFTIAIWAKPGAGTSLPAEAVFGKGNYFNPRNDVLFPLLGHYRYRSPDHAGVGISVGTNGVWVIENSADYWGSPLVYAMDLTNWTHLAVVYEDASPRLYLNGKLARQGLQSPFVVHCSVGVQPKRDSAPFAGELGPLFHDHKVLNESEVAQLMSAMAVPDSAGALPVVEVFSAGRCGWEAEVWQPGQYSAMTAFGRQLQFEASLPQSVEIGGPWQVSFPEGRGAPKSIVFDHLTSWSDHSDQGIRHFSGTAIYSRVFDLPSGWIASGRRVYLDLGQVAVMADVVLNGKTLGTLWKPPFRMEVTAALKAGPNLLEVNVVNLWINRMIGDEDLPEDSLRNQNGSLKEWPEWLRAGKPSPSGRFTFSTYRLWSKDAPLQTSGLIGPVKLIPTARIFVGK